MITLLPSRKLFLVAEMDHSHHDCILIAVLSHGEMGIIYAKDTPYKPDHLWSMFAGNRCRTLAGTLSVFIYNKGEIII